jgi:hypothetical protein
LQKYSIFNNVGQAFRLAILFLPFRRPKDLSYNRIIIFTDVGQGFSLAILFSQLRMAKAMPYKKLKNINTTKYFSK